MSERGYNTSRQAVDQLITGKTYRDLNRYGRDLPSQVSKPGKWAQGQHPLAEFRESIGSWHDGQLLEWLAGSQDRLAMVSANWKSSPVEYELLCFNAVLLELVLRRFKPCCGAEPAADPAGENRP